MKIAVFGCLHGLLDEMYKNVERYEQSSKTTVELVIVCGDCQTVRHQHDLICVSIPPKYHQLGDFHNYYSGKRKIPKLTIFVGGNHEASNYLSTLAYGGWICENFYYMGYANVIRYKGLRIAGISGIYNYHSSDLGRFERLPYDNSTMRSAYHTRNIDIYRLHQLAPYQNDSSDRVDIFLSHDWPQGIYNHGDYKQLMRFKPFFTNEINQNSLGNPLTRPLIGHLKPRHWFAAHLHCKFTARVAHDGNQGDVVTDFLSLDKIKPRSRFMEVIDIEPKREFDNQDDNIYYDSEWLSVLRATNELTSTSKIPQVKYPHYSSDRHRPNERDIAQVHKMMKETSDTHDAQGDDNQTNGYLRVAQNFVMSEPVIYGRDNPSIDESRSMNFPNPQTVYFCSRLNIKDPISDFVDGPSNNTSGSHNSREQPKDSDESSSSESSEARQDKKVKIFQEEGCLPFYIDSHGHR